MASSCGRAQRRPKHLVSGPAWCLVGWPCFQSQFATGNAGPFFLMADRLPVLCKFQDIVGPWQEKPKAVIPVAQKVTVLHDVGAQC